MVRFLGGHCVDIFICVYKFYAINGRHLPCCPYQYLLPRRDHFIPVSGTAIGGDGGFEAASGTPFCQSLFQ
jgi:hypothetical protein